MARSNAPNFKSPPVMSEDITYEDWKSDVEIWSDVTDLADTKQGGAVFLSLAGNPKAQDTVRAGVTREEMKGSDGLEKVLKALDALFKKDATRSAFASYENFTKFRRSPDMNIEDYMVEFNIRYSKVKTLNMALPDGVLAYYVLECANLTEEQQNICRATCSTLKYDDMKEQILRVTSSDKKSKYESQFYSQEQNHYPDESGATYPYPQQYAEPPYEYQYENSYEPTPDDENSELNPPEPQNNEVYYAPARGGKAPPYRHPNSQFPRRNPPDEFGNPRKCSFCQSIFHMINDCHDHKTSSKRPSYDQYNARRGNASYRGRYSRGANRGGFNHRQSYTPNQHI